jgi:hypothetical protein
MFGNWCAMFGNWCAMFGNWCAIQWKHFIVSNLIPELVTHKQLPEGIMADPWRGYVRLERVKKWPKSMTDIWRWWQSAIYKQTYQLCNKVKHSRDRPCRPRSFQEVKVPRFQNNGTTWCWVVSLKHRQPLALGYTWYSFLLEPNSIGRIMSLEKIQTSSGIFFMFSLRLNWDRGHAYIISHHSTSSFTKPEHSVSHFASSSLTNRKLSYTPFDFIIIKQELHYRDFHFSMFTSGTLGLAPSTSSFTT